MHVDEYLYEQAEALGSAGAALWRSVIEHDPPYELRPDELWTVYEAARTADRIAVLDAAQAQEPLTAYGSAGQPVAAPLIQEVRQQRATQNVLLKSLKLPDDRAAAGTEDVEVRNRANSRAMWEARRLG